MIGNGNKIGKEQVQFRSSFNFLYFLLAAFVQTTLTIIDAQGKELMFNDTEYSSVKDKKDKWRTVAFVSDGTLREEWKFETFRISKHDIFRGPARTTPEHEHEIEQLWC